MNFAAVCLVASLALAMGCARAASMAPPPSGPLDVTAATTTALQNAPERSVVAKPRPSWGFLSAVTVVRGSRGPVHGRSTATLRIRGRLGDAIGELAQRAIAVTPLDDGVELTLRGYPTSTEPPRPEDRGASFVVDFDTPEVEAVRDEVISELGESPSMPKLVEFVAKYIDKKNLMRGFDPASVVARRREGDCTEHATLLAALARSFDYAARIVFGLVFTENDADSREGLKAERHAWVEWHDGRRWLPVDAALPAPLDPLYLPMGRLIDEGPGHLYAMASVGLVSVSEVTIFPVDTTLAFP